MKGVASVKGRTRPLSQMGWAWLHALHLSDGPSDIFKCARTLKSVFPVHNVFVYTPIRTVDTPDIPVVPRAKSIFSFFPQSFLTHSRCCLTQRYETTGMDRNYQQKLQIADGFVYQSKYIHLVYGRLFFVLFLVKVKTNCGQTSDRSAFSH